MPWQQHAFVSTRVPGRVSALYVQPGEIFTAWRPLAEAESLELENLQLALRDAQRGVELSGRTLERFEPLVKRGAVAGRSNGSASCIR